MGNTNILTIQENISKMTRSELFSLSLTKLREYHGRFKSECENFSMNSAEFTNVFGQANAECFHLWANDSQGLIDALELFSGLLLFAEATFEEKTHFLFDMYDFNELNSLSLIDIEFMLSCCTLSTFRICQITSDVNEEEIMYFIKNEMQNVSRVNVSQLIRFFANSLDICNFFTIIKRSGPDHEQLTLNDKVRAAEEASSQIPLRCRSMLARPQEVSPRESAPSESLQSALQIIGGVKEDRAYKASLNWVYGYRVEDVYESICFCPGEDDFDNRLIYLAANVVVVYYFQVGVQRHYREHVGTVTAICASARGGLVASSDYSEGGFRVHVWEAKSLRRQRELSMSHDLAPYLLKFFDEDSKILIACLKARTPVFCFALRDGALLRSFELPNFVLGLELICDLAGRWEEEGGRPAGSPESLRGSFFALSRGGFSFFHLEGGSLIRRDFDLRPRRASSAVAFHTNLYQPELELFREQGDFSICLLVGFEDGGLLLFHGLEGPSPRFVELAAKKQAIVKLLHLGRGKVVALTSEPILFEFGLSREEPITSIQLVHHLQRVASTDLREMIYGGEGAVFLASAAGDLFRLDLRARQGLDGEAALIARLDVHRLPAGLSSLKIVEREDETLILTAGAGASVLGFSATGHQLIDTWAVGENITALDVLCNREGGLTFAVGTLGGKIKLRIDWEESSKVFSAEKQILALKFSEKEDKLIAAAANLFLYVFSLEKWGYMDEHNKYSLGERLVLTLNFCLNNSTLLISPLNGRPFGYSLANRCEVEVNSAFKQVKLRFGTEPAAPALVAPGLSLVAASSSRRGLSISRASEVPHGGGLLLFGHGAALVDLEISPKLSTLYSLAADRALFEWKLLQRTATCFAEVGEATEWPEAEKMVQWEILASSSAKMQAYLRESLGYFRGFEHETLRTIFREQYGALNEEELSHKNYPEVSLKLEHVFGLNAAEKRGTVFLVHAGPVEESALLDGTADARLCGGLRAGGRCFRDSQCEPAVVMLASRLAILFRPGAPHIQEFYQGHRDKIACAAVHGSKKLVATGEAAVSPRIHVWLAGSLRTVSVIRTGHAAGIMTMRFACRGALLYSVGVDRHFSLQASDWRTGRTVAFRHTGTEKIVELASDPQKPEFFATSSIGCVDLWRLRCNAIEHRARVALGDSSVRRSGVLATALEYLPFSVGGKNKQALLVGDASGKLGIVTNKRYRVVFDDAAKAGLVAVIRVAETSDGPLVFVVRGSTVLTLDLNFRPTAFKIELKQNSRVQSLDLFACESPTSVLLGTAEGQVFMTQRGEELKRLFVAHAAQPLLAPSLGDFAKCRRIHIAASKKQGVIASAGDDKILRFWSVKENMLIKEVLLPFVPTVAKFSPTPVGSDSEMLVLGARDGIIAMYFVTYIQISGSNLPLDVDPGQIHVLHEATGAVGDKDMAVLNIEISPNGMIMAVAYESYRRNIEKEDRGKATADCDISIFQLKEYYHLSRNTATLSVQKPLLLQPMGQSEGGGRPGGHNVGVHFMTFTTDDAFLMLCYQKIDAHQIRENRDRESNYIVMDLRTNNSHMNQDSLKGAKFRANTFPNSLVGERRVFDLHSAVDLFALDKLASPLDELDTQRIVVSALHSRDRFSFLGDVEGDLFICKNALFSLEREKVNESELYSYFCTAKTYAAHTSFVDRLEFLQTDGGDWLYTTGLSDECIYKWKVQYSDPSLELDHIAPLDHALFADEFLGEVPDRESLAAALNSHFPVREQLFQLAAGVDLDVFPKVRLEISRVVGRHACHARNTLLRTLNDQLFYPAGGLLVGTHLRPNLNGPLARFALGARPEAAPGAGLDGAEEFVLTRLDPFVPGKDQQVLLPDHGLSKSGAARIAAVAINAERSLTCVAVENKVASLYFWDLSACVFASAVNVPELVLPLHLAFSFDSLHLAVAGVTRESQLGVFLVGVRESLLLAQLRFSFTLPSKIKALGFVPGSNSSFVTAGIMHFSQWHFYGQTLSFTELKTEEPNPAEKLERTDRDSKDRLASRFRSFLALSFLSSEKLVLGSDAGDLYLHLNFECVNRLRVSSQAITVIERAPIEGHFVAGGLSGELAYCRIHQVQDKIFLIQTHSIALFGPDIELRNSPKQQVQSLVFWDRDMLVCGTRDGSLYQLDLDWKSAPEENPDSPGFKPLQLPRESTALAQFSDHELPQAATFSQCSEKLFTLSRRGVFAAYDIASGALLEERIYEKSTGLDIVMMCDKIILVYKNLLLTIDQDYRAISPLRKEFPQDIKIVNKNADNILAVVLEAKENIKPQIILFEVKQLTFEQKSVLTTNEIEFIDFTNDNKHMMYREVNGEIFRFDIEQQKIINTSIEFDAKEISWRGDALRFVSQFNKLSEFSKQNEITKILKYDSDTLILTDEMGTIRVYSYPCLESSYYRLYSHHLNRVHICSLSPDKKKLVTSSILDRCFFVWNIELNDYDEALAKNPKNIYSAQMF